MTDSRFYYAPLAAPRGGPVVIEALGVAERMRPGHIVHHADAPSALIMQFHDAVEVDVDGRWSNVGAGSTVIWPARCGRRYGHPTAPWNHSWVNFVGSESDRLLAASALPLGQPMNLGAGEVIKQYLGAMCDELIHHVPPDAFVISSLMRLLLHELSRLVEQLDGGLRMPPRLRAVGPYITANLHRPLRLDELARRCHLSVSQFSALFSRCYGSSPMAFVQQMRMSRAAMLLAQRNQSVAQVAAAVGFDDPLHFSRRFKQHHGVSPTAYRQTIA